MNASQEVVLTSGSEEAAHARTKLVLGDSHLLEDGARRNVLKRTKVPFDPSCNRSLSTTLSYINPLGDSYY